MRSRRAWNAVAVAVVLGLLLPVTTGVARASAQTGGGSWGTWSGSGISLGEPVAEGSPAELAADLTAAPETLPFVYEYVFDPALVVTGGVYVAADVVVNTWNCNGCGYTAGAGSQLFISRVGSSIEAYMYVSGPGSNGSSVVTSRTFTAEAGNMCVIVAAGGNVSRAIPSATFYIHCDDAHPMQSYGWPSYWGYTGQPASFGLTDDGARKGTSKGYMRIYSGPELDLLTPDDLEAYITGGSYQPGVAESFVPRLSCGRTLRDMGNGQWFADVEAIVRNPDPDAEDIDGVWHVSWGEDTYVGRSAVIPLPAQATSDDALYVSYEVLRTTQKVIGWSAEEESGLEWVESPEVQVGLVLPAWALWDEGADAVEGVQENGSGPGFWVQFDVDGDGVVGEKLPPQPRTTVKGAKAICNIRVSPVMAHEDPDQIVINIPPHPEDPYEGGPDDGSGAPPPPPAEGSASCDRGLGWNPWNYVVKLGCAVTELLDFEFPDLLGILGDIWGFLSGLVTKLLEWFVPDVGSWFDDVEGVRTAADGRVPFSWLADLTDAGQQLAGFRATESACGLVLDGWNPSDGPDPVLPASGDPACAGGALGSSGTTSFGLVRSALSLFIWAGAFGVMWRSAPWNKGKSAGEPGVFE